MKISARPCSETHKYIYVSDLIELISFSSKPNIKIAHVALYLIDANFDKQVTSYFSNRGRSYSKDMHRENFGFDINTREYLTHCDDIRYLTSKYFLPNDLEGVEDGFCYLIEELKSIDCIKDLDIDFGSSAMFKVTEASRKYNDDLNPYIFRLSDTMDFKESNPFRDKLAVLDTYSVMYAACLLSGDSPTEIRKFQSHLEFTQVFSEYISYKLMIELAIKNNELKNNDDKILASDLKEYLGKNGYFFRGFNDWMAIEPAKPLINNKPNEQLEASNNKLKEAQAKIADLENQLAQANAALAGKPSDSITQSNTDIHNIKKEAIKQFNRSLATVLIELDYKGKLRKGDIANYIVPYMKELAFVLADEQQDKADNLTVTYDTLYDNHLKNLGFKQGRQSDDEKQKVNIDLLFKKQLPITE